ncbi:hypothetical protein EHS13_26020 [Paenibacillus psychroresistens]|uniref:CBM-cenC domain-containing protein n=1 Tax=Paenibacillus psychroresistens TaxID=1778678 RepID=A0A6B8RQH7_9BACL|nr:carbohydrate binding domain-containing protein [Paenibacillus psychroresistens]QGQ98097.1 hypothetical protein EHS13_26020 [Paenibacillus psychroresistens]
MKKRGLNFLVTVTLCVLMIFSSLQIHTQSASAADTLVTYTAPAGVVANPDFTVKARTPGGAWVDLFEYNTKVDMTTNSNASMVNFSMSGTVEVSVTYNGGTVNSRQVRPVSYGIAPTASGNTTTFTLNQPRNLSFEVNGDRLHNLHIFANPLETNVPIQGAAGVIWFGPGITNLPGGILNVASNQKVYLAGGAVVRGKLVFTDVSNSSVSGRGILDFSTFNQADKQWRGIDLMRTSNISIEGITILDATSYGVFGGKAYGLTVNNLKVINRSQWGDGIDCMACVNVTIDNSFLRTSDDSIAVYATRWEFAGGSRYFTVQNSTLWADVAHPINIGTHAQPNGTDIIEDLTFKNIDVLEHDEQSTQYQGVMSIMAGDSATVRNSLFENIRVEHFTKGKLFYIKTVYNTDYNLAPGKKIENITFRNITYNGTGANPSEIAGYSATNNVDGIKFDNVRINGILVTNASSGNITVGANVLNVQYLNTGTTATPTPVPTPSPTPPPPTPTPGVMNGGLETGVLTPWTNWQTASVVNNNARTGTYAIQLTGGPGSAEQIVTGLQANKTYTLSGYAKTPNGEAVRIGVKNYNATMDIFTAITSSAYTLGNLAFTTGATNTAATIYFYKPSGSGLTYGDDFAIVPGTPAPTATPTPTPVPTPGPNKVVNPGFESGALTPWANWQTASVVASNARTGTKAVQLNGGPGSAEQIITGLQANTTYTLTGYLKTPTGQEVRLGVKNYNGVMDLSTPITAIAYTLSTLTFTTGGSNTSATIYVYKPSGTGLAYGDDFSVN